MAAIAGVIKRQRAANFHAVLQQMAANSLPPFAAMFGTTFHPNDFVRGWCLEKMKAFKFQKAAKNHVRLNVSNWLVMDALTGRSETDSETKQVGSGINGRRRS
jgi:hypothetical protein